MKSSEQLHQDKLERETHEILLIVQGSKRTLDQINERHETLTRKIDDNLEHSRRAEENAIEALASAKRGEAATVRAQLAAERCEQQVGFCRTDVSQVNGRLDAIEGKLDRYVTAMENIERMLRKRDKTQGGSAATTDHAAARTSAGGTDKQ